MDPGDSGAGRIGGHRVKSRMARLVVLVVVLALAWPPLAAGLALALVVRAEEMPAEALMVLSGSPVIDERVARATELFQRGLAPRVILTNDGARSRRPRGTESRPLIVERSSDALEAAGVPRGQIVRLPAVVRSTYDEAAALRVYLQENPLASVLVVTSPYHSLRARWVFRRVMRGTGTRVDVTSVTPGVQSPLPSTWWRTRRGWQSVAAEYVKLGYYMARY